MTRTILEVDGVDLFPFLRATPGEGFDPLDTDYREPQFGDPIGVGEPLLGVSQHNREIVIPVHIKTGPDVLTNRITNPGFEIDTTGWTIGASGTSTLVTGARQTGWYSKGKASLRFSASVGASGSTNFVNATCPATGSTLAAPGDTWTAILDLNVLNNSSQIVVSINWFNSVPAFLSTAAVTITRLGEQRVLVRGVAPANTAYCNLTVQVSSTIGSADMYVDNVALVNTSSTYEPFTGDDINAYWFGTPHNSISVSLAGRDGLSQSVEYLHRVLANAKTFSWRDGGTTDTTFYDIQFARFEPEYNYRRSQAGYQSGVIRIFTKPYGLTGTYRALAALSTGSGPINQFNVGSVAGDMPALVQATVENRDGPDRVLTPGQIFGLSAVPSGYSYNIPVSSITLVNPSAIIKTTAAAAASYVNGTNVILMDNDVTFQSGMTKFGAISFSPASVYQGRNRVIALVAAGGDKFLEARDDTTNMPLMLRPAVATGPGMHEVDFTVWGFNAVDLGVWNVEKNLARATVGLTLHVENPDWNDGNPLVYGGDFALNKLIIVPEERSIFVHDYARRLLGWDRAQMNGSTASGIGVAIDQLGNPFNTSALSGIATQFIGNKALFVPAASGAGVTTGAGLISHPTVADITFEANIENISLASGALVAVGKYVGGANVSFNARVHYTTSSGAVLTLNRGSIGGPGFAPASLLASKAIASVADAVLTFSTKGPVVQGMVRTSWGSIVATISASHALAGAGGQGFFGMSASGNGFVGVRGFVISSTPSSPNDVLMSVDGLTNTVVGMASSNRIVSDLKPFSRGVIPTVDPYDTLVAMHMSAEGGPSHHTGSIGVNLQERFSYAR